MFELFGATGEKDCWDFSKPDGNCDRGGQGSASGGYDDGGGHGDGGGSKPGDGGKPESGAGNFHGTDRSHDKYSEFLDSENLIPTAYRNGYIEKQLARQDAFGKPLSPVTTDEIAEYQKRIGNNPRLGQATAGEVEDALTGFNDWLDTKRKTERDAIWATEFAEKEKERNAIREAKWKSESEDIHQRQINQAKALISQIQDSVIAFSKKARQTLDLPIVSAQLEQEASDYIRTQLTESENLVATARDGAGEDLSPEATKMIAEFAMDTVNSINSFLGGLTVGMAEQAYKTALSVTQVAAAIYQNPQLLNNLANSILLTFTSSRFLSDFKYQLVALAKILAEGSAYEKGLALGDLGSFLIFGIAGLEKETAGKLALEDLANKVIENEVAEELTSLLTPAIKASGVVKEEVVVLEQAIESSRSIVVNHSQLQRKFKHANIFGITENLNKQTLSQFKQAVEAHVRNPNVKVIEGTYHQTQKVTHYVDPISGINIIKDSMGNFISTWKLNSDQLKNVLERGSL